MSIAMVIYYNNMLTMLPYRDDFGNRYIETDSGDLLNIEHGCYMESFFDNENGEEDSEQIFKAWIHYCYNKADTDEIDLSDLRDYFSDYLDVYNNCKRIKLTDSCEASSDF